MLFSKDAYPVFETHMVALKRAIFGTPDIVFHSVDIRKRNHAFRLLHNDAKRDRFMKGISDIVRTHDFKVVASVIDKKRYAAAYPQSTADVYKIALEFIMERTMYHLAITAKGDARVSIVVESRGKREDAALLAAFNHIRDSGNRYNEPARFQQFFRRIEFKRKRDQVQGLELADLCAYPIGRHATDSVKSHPSYPHVCAKMLISKAGSVDGYGLKMFPHA